MRSKKTEQNLTGKRHLQKAEPGVEASERTQDKQRKKITPRRRMPMETWVIQATKGESKLSRVEVSSSRSGNIKSRRYRKGKRHCRRGSWRRPNNNSKERRQRSASMRKKKARIISATKTTTVGKQGWPRVIIKKVWVDPGELLRRPFPNQLSSTPSRCCRFIVNMVR